MKLTNTILFLMIFSFFILPNYVFSSTTDGTINPTYKYAWGENVGFIDFGSDIGSVHISDSDLSGYAYSDTIGWINLSGVTNNSEGKLSGYAWGENVGFIDFSHATIGDGGIFSGYAWGENIGFITFGTESDKVVTDWRSINSPERKVSSSSGSSSGGLLFGCKDPKALNYRPFSFSQPSLCEYVDNIETSSKTNYTNSEGIVVQNKEAKFSFKKEIKDKLSFISKSVINKISSNIFPEKIVEKENIDDKVPSYDSLGNPLLASVGNINNDNSSFFANISIMLHKINFPLLIVLVVILFIIIIKLWKRKK